MSFVMTPLRIEALNLAQTVAHSRGRVCVEFKVTEVRGSRLPAWHVFAKFDGARKGVNVGAIVSPSWRGNPTPWQSFGLAQSWGTA